MRPSGTKESTYNLRGDKILTLPKVNTTKYGIKSVRYEGANLWNKLPNEYRKADSYKLFKKQILDTDLAGRYMPHADIFLKPFFNFTL